jgi:hypothetical protein
VYEEVSAWLPLQWGARALLPLGAVTISTELPGAFTMPHHAHALGASLAGGSSRGAELADELDGDTGLPLCLLPRAAGQQGLTPGAFSEVRPAAQRSAAQRSLTLPTCPCPAQPARALSLLPRRRTRTLHCGRCCLTCGPSGR